MILKFGYEKRFGSVESHNRALYCGEVVTVKAAWRSGEAAVRNLSKKSTGFIVGDCVGLSMVGRKDGDWSGLAVGVTDSMDGLRVVGRGAMVRCGCIVSTTGLCEGLAVASGRLLPPVEGSKDRSVPLLQRAAENHSPSHAISPSTRIKSRLSEHSGGRRLGLFRRRLVWFVNRVYLHYLSQIIIRETLKVRHSCVHSFHVIRDGVASDPDGFGL
jgi:hypothetical protein